MNKINRLVIIITVGVFYLVAGQAWFLAANSRLVGDGSRGLLKGVCLVAALVVYVATAAGLALTSETGWARQTGTAAGLAALLGALLTAGVSAVWSPSQLFHDTSIGQRLPFLLLELGGLGLLAAVAAVAIGRVVRAVRRDAS